jgi:hypothetical protein
MFLPMKASSPAEKASTKGNGRSFTLSRHQRTQLLQDEVLTRFAWVFSGSPDDSLGFMLQMQAYARKDGFRVSFPSLDSGNHIDNLGGELDWGRGSIVASNVTRSMRLCSNTCSNVGCPQQLPRCGLWTHVTPADPIPWKGEGKRGAGCACLPCKKMRAICAEFFESETIVLTSQISMLYVVLQRAYSTYGTAWWV